MHIYMPSPLSGMLQEEEERVEVLRRRDGKGGQKRRYVYVYNSVCMYVCMYSVQIKVILMPIVDVVRIVMLI